MQFPQAQFFLLSEPEPHVLLITINRPKQFNALSPDANFEMSRILDWAEDEPNVWCIVVCIQWDAFILYIHIYIYTAC